MTADPAALQLQINAVRDDADARYQQMPVPIAQGLAELGILIEQG
jgi:hypothetical protein